MTKVFVAGSSGFIGGHLVKALKEKGYYVIGADIEMPKYEKPDKFWLRDLRYQANVYEIFQEDKIEDVYLLACLMGGMGYIGADEHEFDIVVGSSQIVANIIDVSVKHNVKKLFYSSSACAYNMHLQDENSDCIALREYTAYPAMPDLPYGWQKLFSEQMCKSAKVSKGLDIRIARFHNIFGTNGVYDGGKEKAPAALARKIALAKDGDEIEVWGDGTQRRSFLYIDECIEGTFRLMESDFKLPINIGSSESVTINELATMLIKISGKQLRIRNVESPFVGVACRNSDNTLIYQELNWKPSKSLYSGLEILYSWVNKQVNNK